MSFPAPTPRPAYVVEWFKTSQFQGEPAPDCPGWYVARRDYVSMDGSIVYLMERRVYA